MTADTSGRRLFGAVRQVFREAVQAGRPPLLDVEVELPAGAESPGRRAARRESATVEEAVVAAVEAAVTEHAVALGVPARPQVAVRWSVGVGTVPRLVLGGRPVRVPAEDLASALAGRGAGDGSGSADPAAWAALAGTATRVALEHDPAVLIGPRQRDALVARARMAGVRPSTDDDVLGAVLELAVARGIAVRDLAPLPAALEPQVGLLRKAGELAEVAIDALARPDLEIRLGEVTLRSATLAGPHRLGFADLRRQLFQELGVLLPDVTVTVDDGVPGGMAAVRLNAVPGAARPLPAGAGTAPLVALLGERVRAHPSWFVSLAEVRRSIEGLRLALPDLVAAVRDRYEDPQLAMLARTFVDERLPVRNLARLMILLLDAPSPSAGWDVVRLAEPTRRTDRQRAPGPRGLVSYTRQQINEEAGRARPGLAAVPHPRLSVDLDQALKDIRLGAAGVDVEARAAALDRLVVLAERALAESGEPAVVTATQHSRSVASRLLAWQYPEMAVLAAEEFPPSHRLPPAG